jgi:hypothetical protein
MLSQTLFPFPPEIFLIDHEPSEASKTKKLAPYTRFCPIKLSDKHSNLQRSLWQVESAPNHLRSGNFAPKTRSKSYLLLVPGGEVDSRTTNSGSTTICCAAFTPAPDPICCNTV